MYSAHRLFRENPQGGWISKPALSTPSPQRRRLSLFNYHSTSWVPTRNQAEQSHVPVGSPPTRSPTQRLAVCLWELVDWGGCAPVSCWRWPLLGPPGRWRHHHHHHHPSRMMMTTTPSELATFDREVVPTFLFLKRFQLEIMMIQSGWTKPPRRTP